MLENNILLDKAQQIGDMMDEIEALCNKNADTIFEIQCDNNLSLEIFEHEVMLFGVEKFYPIFTGVTNDT